jgi:hypothetical protein
VIFDRPGAQESMRSVYLERPQETAGDIGVRRCLALAIGTALILLWLLTPARLQAGQATPTFLSSDAEYSFGQVMRFSLEAASATPVRKVTLYIQTPESPYSLTADIDVGMQENVSVSRVVDHTRVRLVPFTTVTYWWLLETESGETFKSDPQTLEYIDDQFAWQRRERDGVQINWSGEDDDVGLTAESAVFNALPKIEAVIPIARPDPLRVYVYPSAADLRAGLRLTGRDWVGGHAHPELGVILVAVDEPYSGTSEVARSISHELAHLYLYEATGEGYESVPLWLDEGIATMIEGAAGNPIYRVRLEEALASGETIPFADLCYTMPAGEDDALLAYAQSSAFVSYLQLEYGDQALQRLVGAVADGADCQSATLRALGKSLAELNDEWLEQAMPRSPIERAWQNGRAWLVVLLVGFLLVALLARMPRGRTH